VVVRPSRRPPLAAAPGRLRRRPDLLGGLLLAAGLVVVALVARGGTVLGANTAVQVGLLAAAAVVAGAVVLLGAPGRWWGAPAVLLFAALAALAYASIAWSVEPGASWLQANRTLSYLAAFAAAAALARLAPGRWRAMLAAVAAAATAVAAYALLAKIFPASLDASDPLGRLNVPLDYWNAIGLMAAMGIPACLGAAADEGSPRILRVLCPPAIALLVAVLLMSFSRGALAIAILGGLAWFAAVPVRLRAAALLALGAAGGGVIAAWALPSHNLTADRVALAARSASGHTFGLVVLGVVLAGAAAGWGLALAMERVALGPRVRRRVGTALLAALALVPVAGIVALAASSRGLTGEVSHVWATLTSPNGGVGDRPTRLLTLSNNRTRYWGDGLTVGEHHLALGAGAGGFDVAHRRYTTYPYSVSNAHSYLIETFADLGLVGVAISLALLAAWAIAASRPLGVEWEGRRPRLRAPPGAARGERVGMVTLAVVVVMFGLHNLIDWTWLVPGTAVVALACAGWLAGRGPLDGAVGRLPRPRSLTRSPGAGAALVGVLAALIALAWVTVQPLRSSQADAAAVRALVQGNSGLALTRARQAVAADPVALEPMLDLAEVYAARGQVARARAELWHAVAVQGENPASWQALGSFDLGRGRARLAVGELARALALDPANTYTAQLLAQAQAQAR